MLETCPEGFTKHREDNPKSWKHEQGLRTHLRYSHAITGMTVEGNRVPKFCGVSLSRAIHGINVFPTSQADLDSLPNLVSTALASVIAEPCLGSMTGAEIFINLPLVCSDVLEQVEGRPNSCFRRVLEEHREDFGLYVFNGKHHRFNPKPPRLNPKTGKLEKVPNCTTKTLLIYDKAIELWKCQGVPLLSLRGVCGNVCRFELRLSGPALRELEPFNHETCYAVIRRHLMGYGLPQLDQFLPESFTDFQNQEWRHV